MSVQANFYPQHCEVPREKPMDKIKRLSSSLKSAIQSLEKEEMRQPGFHAEALKCLSDIFGKKVKDVVAENILPEPASAMPMAPKAI